MKKTKGINLIVEKYKEYGFKKFMKKWGEGIEGVTPLQQTKVSLLAIIIVCIGITYGIIFNIFFTQIWWLVVILGGSLPLTLMQLVALYQKYVKLKEVEKTLKELNNGKKI